MRTNSFLPALALGLLALPLTAWADRNPDFDDDAKPILRMQPGLLEYVEARFEIKDTGKARIPGNDAQPPQPPFMFKAKPRGMPGPYNLMLLIQPGPVNHILNVVDMTRVQLHPPAISSAQQPSVASQSAPAPAPAPAAPPATTPEPAQSSDTTSAATPVSAPAPTSDTPSGPIRAGQGTQTAPSLEPPADPAPTTH